AFASGFGSVRRFNDAFRSHYRMPPSRLRRFPRTASREESLSLTSSYRPPFAWAAMLNFLRARTLAGVEYVADGVYSRTIALGRHRGWLRVPASSEKPTLHIELSTSLSPVLARLLARLRNFFDLDARPDVIASHLEQDCRLGPLLRQRPGL